MFFILTRLIFYVYSNKTHRHEKRLRLGRANSLVLGTIVILYKLKNNLGNVWRGDIDIFGGLTP